MHHCTWPDFFIVVVIVVIVVWTGVGLSVLPRLVSNSWALEITSYPCLPSSQAYKHATSSTSQAFIWYIMPSTNSLVDSKRAWGIPIMVSDSKTVTLDGQAPNPCWRACYPTPSKQPAGPIYGLRSWAISAWVFSFFFFLFQVEVSRLNTLLLWKSWEDEAFCICRRVDLCHIKITLQCWSHPGIMWTTLSSPVPNLPILCSGKVAVLQIASWSRFCIT